MSTQKLKSKLNINYKKICFPVIILLLLFSITTCENKIPDEPKESIGNVAEGLKEATDFERDTVRKDGVRLEKENIKSINK
jgi:hypothetical protein